MLSGMLALALLARADTGFVQAVTADDFVAAGLKKLTPAELARLELLVEQYKAGVVTAVQSQAAESASVSRLDLERKVATAEAKAKAAEIKAKEAEAKMQETQAKEAAAKVAAAPAKKQPGWFTALLTLNRAAEKPDKRGAPGEPPGG